MTMAKKIYNFWFKVYRKGTENKGKLKGQFVEQFYSMQWLTRKIGIRRCFNAYCLKKG